MIVGSVRRKKPIVHDLELLVEPRFQLKVVDLFGGTLSENLLEAECARLRDAGVFEPVIWGSRLKRFVFQDVPCELFIMLPPSQWGMGAVIRTGPADFSRRLVTAKAMGGLMPHGWRVHDLGIYDVYDTLIETPEETDVFEALSLKYIEPERRA